MEYLKIRELYTDRYTADIGQQCDPTRCIVVVIASLAYLLGSALNFKRN